MLEIPEPQIDLGDERLGLPSASGAARWFSCPGSHAAEQTVKEDPNQDLKETVDGTRGHEFIAEFLDAHSTAKFIERPDEGTPLHFQGKPLTPDEMDFLSRAIRTRNAIVQMAFPKGEEDFDSHLVEKRLVVRDQEFEPATTAQLDYGLRKERTLLIIDWKTGRGDIEEAKGNHQLKTQLVAALQEFGADEFDEIFVAIGQPNGMNGQITIARYAGQIAFAFAEHEVIEKAKQAMLPNQPRIPGAKQCRWCKFSGSCPEAQAYTRYMIETQAGEKVTPDELEFLAFAEKTIKARKEKAKAQLEDDPFSIDGYEIGKGRAMTKADPVAAWSKIGIRIGGNAFAQACSVSIPKLADALATHSKIAKKEARKEVEETLEADGAIKRSQTAGSIQKIAKKI